MYKMLYRSCLSKLSKPPKKKCVKTIQKHTHKLNLPWWYIYHHHFALLDIFYCCNWQVHKSLLVAFLLVQFFPCCTACFGYLLLLQLVCLQLGSCWHSPCSLSCCWIVFLLHCVLWIPFTAAIGRFTTGFLSPLSLWPFLLLDCFLVVQSASLSLSFM